MASRNLWHFPFHKKVHVQKQEGDNDCGLFALAYIESLCRGHEPRLIEYDQSYMRHA